MALQQLVPAIGIASRGTILGKSVGAERERVDSSALLLLFCDFMLMFFSEPPKLKLIQGLKENDLLPNRVGIGK